MVGNHGTFENKIYNYSVFFKQFVTTLTKGAGYGGGASYKDNEGETLGVGLPGVALIEIGVKN